MNINDYMKLPYSINLKPMNDENGKYFFATVKEMPGCMSDGKTLEEAYANVSEAMKLWIETKLDGGYPVPLPYKENPYSGRFNIRIPKELHARLASEAELEGVSLNQYVLYKLSS